MDESQILKVLQNNYSKDIESIKHLRDGGCTSYIVVCKNSRFLLKVVSTPFFETIKQSIDIMCYLKQNAFPVPEIMKTVSDQLYISINENGKEYMFILFEYI